MTMRFLTLLLCMTAMAARLAAAGSSEIEEGNRAFRAGKYDAALAAYEKASVKDPESPYVLFDKGAAYYRQEDLEKAKEAFQQAALKTKDLRFEARAHFNLGNCSFQEGQRQSESDLQKSVEAFQAAVASYQKAYALDPTMQDAVHNIEVTRIILKDLLDRLRKQQEEQKKNQDLYKEVVEKLKSLIARQGAEIEDDKRIAAEEAKSGRTAAVSSGMEKLASDQDATRTGTQELIAKTREIMAKNPPAQGTPQGTQAPESGPEAAVAHMGNSYTEQTGAVQEARAKNPAGALPLQEKSLAELEAALKALTGEGQGQGQDQQQQQQQDKKQDGQQQQQEQQKQQTQDARQIIGEENQRDRRGDAQASGGYRDVDKDW